MTKSNTTTRRSFIANGRRRLGCRRGKRHPVRFPRGTGRVARNCTARPRTRAAPQRSAAAEASGDDAAAEVAYGVWTDLEERMEDFEFRTAGDLVVLAGLAQRQIADGGLSNRMPGALADGIVRLFGKVGD